MKKFNSLPLLLLILAVVIFFKPFLTQGKLPIPSDTIVGLYHPFRDSFAAQYPNGIPYKNFLTTDPVRQQYPWRILSLDALKQASLPIWNPYTMAGTPLLANVQSAAFYPLNILLFIFPYALGWSFLIFLQQILAGVFLYYYLNNLRLNRFASFLGALSFSFSGFIIAWLEWGTIGHTALWLPLLLLTIDKFFQTERKRWKALFVFSLAAALLAGHLQTFFYLYSVTVIYFIARWLQFKKPLKTLSIFILLNLVFFIVTLPQWLHAFQFISLSARNVDQVGWEKPEWFIPWQHLIQFVAPDFFGNPTTLNYWGVWNYGEFVGYVGILPLIMAIFALYNRQDKKTLFFGALFFLALVFSLPTFFAKLPYQLEIPFLSTTQPTRLLFLADFSLAILAALGLDFFIKSKKKWKMFYSLGIIACIFLALWAFVLFSPNKIPGLQAEDIFVAKRNLYIPTFFFLMTMLFLAVWVLTASIKRFEKMVNQELLTVLLLVFLLALTAFDLIRFSQKFTPFTESAYLFPSTKALAYLQSQQGQFRIMSTDSRILPPNFSVMYRLQSLDGYDPLYLLRYGELISAINRDKPDINTPFGFNRIITPQKIDSPFIDVLGVTYILSLTDINSANMQKVFTEGQTKIYKNNNAYPRAFFVKKVEEASDKNKAIQKLFAQKNNLRTVAIVEDGNGLASKTFDSGKAEIESYNANKIQIKTTNKSEGFLVLMDTFYPTWSARICPVKENQCKETTIYRTNYNFRGIVVPAGEHRIEFNASLL